MEKIQVSPSNIAEGMFSVNVSHLIGYDICFSDESQARMVAATIDKVREKDAKNFSKEEFQSKSYEERIEPLLRELRDQNNQGKILWTGDLTFTYREMLALILNGDPRGSAYADAWLQGKTSNLMEDIMKQRK